MSKYVTIKEERYKSLLRSNHELSALEYGGVDNWEWCGESIRDYLNNYIKNQEITFENEEDRYDFDFDELVEYDYNTQLNNGDIVSGDIATYPSIADFSALEPKQVIIIRPNINSENCWDIGTFANWCKDFANKLPKNNILTVLPPDTCLETMDKEQALTWLTNMIEQLNNYKKIEE